MSHVHAFSYIHTFLFLLFDIKIAWYFSNCLSLSPSLSVSYVSFIMALKRKSTPSRNLLRSGASSSSSPSDPTPFHVWFHDEKAKSDFLKNFSWCDIHSERQVILLDFSYIDLPTVIHIGVRNHFVLSQSRSLLWSYRSSTSRCTDFITLYLSFLLKFGVYAW